MAAAITCVEYGAIVADAAAQFKQSHTHVLEYKQMVSVGNEFIANLAQWKNEVTQKGAQAEITIANAQEQLKRAESFCSAVKKFCTGESSQKAAVEALDQTLQKMKAQEKIQLAEFENLASSMKKDLTSNLTANLQGQLDQGWCSCVASTLAVINTVCSVVVKSEAARRDRMMSTVVERCEKTVTDAQGLLAPLLVRARSIHSFQLSDADRTTLSVLHLVVAGAADALEPYTRNIEGEKKQVRSDQVSHGMAGLLAVSRVVVTGLQYVATPKYALTEVTKWMYHCLMGMHTVRGVLHGAAVYYTQKEINELALLLKHMHLLRDQLTQLNAESEEIREASKKAV